MKHQRELRGKSLEPEPPKDILIRAASPADAEALTRLANLPAYLRGTLRLPFQTVEETRNWLDTPSTGTRSLVAEIDGNVVGNSFIGPYAGRRRHVAMIGIGVHDDFAGRGVGSALMAAMLDIADNWLNLRRVELIVFADNLRAIRLYEKCGFVREGHLKDYAFRDGEYIDALQMARIRI